MRERKPEIHDCRMCGTQFDLSAQYYYDNLCPTCKAEEDDEETTWPSCINCQERFEPGTGVTTSVPNRAMRSGSEQVTVCSDECANQTSDPGVHQR